MKAILVINMPEIPKNCMSCPLTDYHREYSVVCRHYQTGDTRPSWCPLRSLPQKKEVEVNDIEDIMHTEYSIEDIYTNKYVATIQLATDKLISLGWNACLDDIMEK